MQTLPDDEKTHSSLTLLEDALTLLTELEYNLLSGKFFIISDMLAELSRQNGDDTEISDSEQHASAPLIQKILSLLVEFCPRMLNQMIFRYKRITCQ